MLYGDYMDNAYAAPEQRLEHLNLNELVQNATWRTLLIELVETNKLDPWDIDISELVESYVATVKHLKTMDLRIPANIILAASTLLRMKGEAITIFDPVIEQQEPDAPLVRQIPEVPTLIPRARLQPGRKITLTELMDALEDAMKITHKREQMMEISEGEPITMLIERNDPDQIMEDAFSLVSKSADKLGMAMFSNIALLFGDKQGILLDFFVPLIFLAHKGRIELVQQEFFGDIIIKLNIDERVK